MRLECWLMLPPIDIGQIPADAAGKLVEGSIADKTTACCEGMKNILEAAGSSISRTVKVSVGLLWLPVPVNRR